MKYRVSVLFLAALAAGCGSTPSDQNNGAVNAPAGNARSTPLPPATPTPTPIVGEKVTAQQDVRFLGEQTPAGWTWTDPTPDGEQIRYEAKVHSLKFTIPTGRDLYGVNQSAPRLMKAVEGDFQIEVRVRLNPREDYQGAGILVYAGPERYLRFERGFGGVGGGTNGLRMDVRTGQNYRAVTTPEDAPTDAATVDLKLLRSGNTFTAFWRPNEDLEWKEIGEYESDYPAAVEVGVIACNTGKPIPVEFYGLKLSPV